MNSYIYQDTQNALGQEDSNVVAYLQQPSVKDEIEFFINMLKTPNLDQSTISYINETIQLLIHKYNHGTHILKVRDR